MQQAVVYKQQHPSETYAAVAHRFLVPASSLHNRLMETHAPPGVHWPRHLSIEQEDALLDKIKAYATRGTLLTPGHMTQLAQALSEEPLGRNWTSTFIRQHTRRPYPAFYRVQEIPRLKADTPSNRQAFYILVRPTPL